MPRSGKHWDSDGAFGWGEEVQHGAFGAEEGQCSSGTVSPTTVINPRDPI